MSHFRDDSSALDISLYAESSALTPERWISSSRMPSFMQTLAHITRPVATSRAAYAAPNVPLLSNRKNRKIPIRSEPVDTFLAECSGGSRFAGEYGDKTRRDDLAAESRKDPSSASSSSVICRPQEPNGLGEQPGVETQEPGVCGATASTPIRGVVGSSMSSDSSEPESSVAESDPRHEGAAG